MRFLSGLFEQKSIDVDTATSAIARAVSGNLRRSITFGRYATSGGWDIDKAINDGLERVIWVFRCVDAIASNGAPQRVVIRHGDPQDGELIQDPRLLRLLNVRPNLYENSQQFRYRLSALLLLSPKGAFVEIVRGRDGRPSQLHILPPGQVDPIPDPKTYVSGYRIKSSELAPEQILEPDRVLWIRQKPHPTDVYSQLTPLSAAGLAADTDFFARMFNRNFLINDGRPSTLIAVRGQLDDDVAAELQRRFSGGYAGAGGTTIIEADAISVEDMGSTPRDAQWLDAIRGSKDDLLLAFGVPESILGNAANRTWDNADAEKEIFWQVTMIPHLRAMASGFDLLTPGGWDDDNYVTFDLSDIDVLQRQERQRHDKLLNDLTNGVITVDEYRIATGREPLGVPGSRVLWIPAGRLAIGEQADADAARMLSPVVGHQFQPQNGVYQQPYPGTVTADGNPVVARALEMAKQLPVELEYKDLDVPDQVEPVEPEGQSDDATPSGSADEPSTESLPTAHPYEALRSSLEGEITGVLSAWTDTQERVILDRLDHAKVRKGTRHWDGEGAGTKTLDPRYIVETARWLSDLRTTMEPTIRRTAAREARKVIKDLDRQGVIDAITNNGEGYPLGANAAERLLGPGAFGVEAAVNVPVISVLNLVDEAARRQTERVLQRIFDMDREGKSLTEIKAEVRRMLGARSSWKRGLAVHATTAIMEGVKAGVLNHAGRYIERKWCTQLDERVRDTHREAHGQTKEGGKPFRVGTSLMMFPGDPSAPIEETAGCRCHVQWDARRAVAGKSAILERTIAMSEAIP